nr:hypothetical protein [Tanacetum cinerariifolium]
RNKPDMDTLSMDDLYSNLKVYESGVKGTSSSTNTQNMAFVSSSSNNSNGSNGVNTAQRVNTANRVNTASLQVNAASSLNIDNPSDAVICTFLASQPNNTHLVNEDLEQIYPDDLEEMDLKWAPRGHDNRSRYVTRRTVPKETPNSLALNASKSLNKILECQIIDNYKKGLGYNAVPPPHTGLFPLLKSDLSYTGLEELFNKPKTEKSKDKSNDVEPESVRKGSDAPIIKDWVSGDEEENVENKEVKPNINRINFVKATIDNNPREIVKNGEQPTQNIHRKRGLEELFNKPKTEKSKDKSNDVEPESVRKGSDAQIIKDWVSGDEEENVENKEVKPSINRINFVKATTNNNPREIVKNGSNWEMFNKSCHECGSCEHLIRNCQHHQNKYEQQNVLKLIWNNSQRANHKNHSNAKRNHVPQAPLTVNAARPINAVQPNRTMNVVNQESYFSKQAHSFIQRPNKKLTALKNSYANKKVKTIWVKKVNTAKPKAAVNAAKAKAKHKAVKGKMGNAAKAST